MCVSVREKERGHDNWACTRLAGPRCRRLWSRLLLLSSSSPSSSSSIAPSCRICLLRVRPHSGHTLRLPAVRGSGDAYTSARRCGKGGHMRFKACEARHGSSSRSSSKWNVSNTSSTPSLLPCPAAVSSCQYRVESPREMTAGEGRGSKTTWKNGCRAH
ncbi:uncharacterized protein B0I36DRAFT_318470 [Microdochium trichocladiopsis]|uniref:Uncharacterized protein n=1 Tax=Microdochium trichocladiopsis TaxID=1682393 RepID=A0A9P9BT25_9PEZI|nr:uncharacterized protein B0I36DRAFT_318470 [Microdochium trichocladiopsis]KAH7035490.1 hypothetical protein B0I36DRAFT_318470 [Microdochium trichocladiopsis]